MIELAGYEAPIANAPINDIIKSSKEVTPVVNESLPESPGLLYADSPGGFGQVGSALVREGQLVGIVAAFITVEGRDVVVIVDIKSETGEELLGDR